MPTITAEAFDQDKYRTSITSPGDAALHGAVTVTLKEAPIGQDRFEVNTNVVVYRTDHHGTQRMTGIVTHVYGPAKYAINLT